MGFFDDAFGAALNFTVGAPLMAFHGLQDVLGGGGGAGAIPPLLMPPLPPDATDEQIRLAVLAQRRRLLLGQGQGPSFVSGPLGDPSAFATSKSSAGGF